MVHMYKYKKIYNFNVQIIQNYLVKYISIFHLLNESQKKKMEIISLIILQNDNWFPFCLFFIWEYGTTR